MVPPRSVAGSKNSIPARRGIPGTTFGRRYDRDSHADNGMVPQHKTHSLHDIVKKTISVS